MSISDDRRVDLWLRRRTVADSDRQHVSHRWTRNWSAYRNRTRVPRVGNASWTMNDPIPDAFRVIETLVAQHVGGIYNNPNWFSIRTPRVVDSDYESIVKQLLLMSWRRADMFRKTVDILKYSMITGHAIAKVVWEEERGEREGVGLDFDAEGNPIGFKRTVQKISTFSGPQVYMPDLMNVWVDPTGRHEWVIERITSSKERLTEANRQHGGRLYKNLRKIPNIPSEAPRAQNPIVGGGTISSGPFDTASLIQRVEGIPDVHDPDAVELLQCWGYVPPSTRRYEDTQWRMCVIANHHTLIRDEPAPSPDLRPPYIHVPAIPIPRAIYGDSILSWIEGLIRFRSFLENARREEVALNLFQQRIVKDGVRLGPEHLARRPGAVIRVSNFLGPIDDVIKTVDRQPVLPEAYQESATKLEQIDRTSGSTDPIQLAFGGGRKSATEFSGTMQVGLARVNMATALMDENLNRPLLEAMFGYLQTRMRQEEVVEIFPGRRMPVNLSDLEYDIDVYVDTGAVGSLDQFQSQQLKEVYGVALASEQASQVLNHGEIIRQLLLRSGEPYPERMILQDDQVSQNQAQQLAIQQRLADQQAQRDAFVRSASSGAGEGAGA